MTLTTAGANAEAGDGDRASARNAIMTARTGIRRSALVALLTDIRLPPFQNAFEVGPVRRMAGHAFDRPTIRGLDVYRVDVLSLEFVAGLAYLRDRRGFQERSGLGVMGRVTFHEVALFRRRMPDFGRRNVAALGGMTGKTEFGRAGAKVMLDVRPMRRVAFDAPILLDRSVRGLDRKS